MKRLFLFLLFAATAQATLTVTDRGSGNSGSVAATTIVVTPSGTIAAGSSAALFIAMDNAGGATANLTKAIGDFYTDSVGNKWYVRFNNTAGSTNQSPEPAVLTSLLTTQMTTSNTLTVNLNNSTTATAWALNEIAPTAGNIALPNWMSTGIANVINLTNSAAPSVGAISPCTGDAVIGFGAAEWNDSWAGDAAWSTMQHNGTGPAGSTGISVISQWRVVSDGTILSYAPTLTLSDSRIGWIDFTETDPRARTNGANNTSESATTITFTGPVAAGSAAVLCVIGDNAATNGGPSTNFGAITDATRANTWTKYQNVLYDPAAANGGVEIAFYVAIIGAGKDIVPGDTISLAYGAAVGAKAWSLWEFAPATTGVMSVVGTGGAGTGANTNSPTVTTGSIALNDYVIGLLGIENSSTGNDGIVGDADTSNGTWKMQLAGTRGANNLGVAISSQYKQVSAAATQTYNPTISVGATAPDTMISWIELNDTSVIGPTAQQKSAFFFLFP